jgi:hypothetical protein
MKKAGLFVLVLFCSIAIINAQEVNQEKDFKFSIQTNAAQLPLELLLNSLFAAMYGNMTDVYIWNMNIEFQYALNNYFTVSVMPMVGITGVPWYEDRYGNTYFYDTFSYNLTLGLQYHFLRTKLKGWYVGIDPRIGISHIKTDITDNLLDIGLMGKVGRQWIRPNGFTISYWFGVGSSWFIPFENNKYKWEKTHLFDLPIDIGGNLSIGYSF